ncbi:MAG: hypothetical protein GVY24_04230 [Planctomycetes bacterium]|nr:hypothetical protein [Planctomycetota bacterium]
MDLAKQQIRFDYKPRLRLEYKPRPLKQHDEPDIPCFGEIILQIDTVKQLTEEPRAQRRHHPPRKRDTS